ncbi:MAG: DUF4465 domain-containing protein, partial [Muribaculaceae bacterium]|nr:DUF4465 domain-containing protein [Muribaculaceae bacterium]
MKKFLTSSLSALCVFGLFAQDNLITLDLSKSTTKLEFNETTGAWTDTYNDDEESIESQCFSFVHGSISDWATWWGFTASNSDNNSFRENFVTYQFSNMAKGGIVLNEDGTIKTDDFGAPVVSAEVPYLVAFYSPWMAARPVDVTFNTGKTYEPVGVYVNLNSYTYYAIQDGDSFARAFNNGDKFTLTVHGVRPTDTESEVSVELASYTNGNLTINRGWSYIDLSELGEINELYFTLKSTDTGAYGDNTPLYFCLDKLMVKETATSGLSNLNAAGSEIIRYDRATKTVTIDGADFAAVYDVTGRKVIATDSSTFSLADVPAGVYVVRAGNACIKIAK